MQKTKTYKWHSWYTPWLFVFPTLIGLFFFRFIPIGASLYLGFTDWNLIRTPEFIGLDNFREMFADPYFKLIVWNTLSLTFWYVVGSMVFGFLLACLINNKMKGMNFFRAAIYMPVITSSVALGIVWSWILGPRFGLLDILLTKVGITAPYWLTDERYALGTITFVQVWKMAGYYMILFLAGLQAISSDVIEAAIVDGANSRQRITRIIIPMLSPTVFFVLTVAIMDAFKNFELIHSMTHGGPKNATNTLVYDVYLNAFMYYRVGYAEAIAYVLLFIVGMLTLMNFVIKKRWAQPLE
ncbi:MAG: sugar ABC transporter permease [Spirochaetales bacterium]|nr:sugar ABC transporter permease [Spirochaetales bacterium]